MSDTPIVELKPGMPPPQTRPNTIAIGEGLSPKEVINAVREGHISHVVQKTAPHFDSELALAHLMIENPGAFLRDPIQAIVGRPWKTEGALYLQVETSVEEKKSRVLGQFENFLKAISGTKTIRDAALLVADELYTNAARNGFLDGKRGEGPVRDGAVEFSAFIDGGRLVFGCIDSFGELSLTRVIGRIGAVSDQGVAEAIQRNTVGAGIGSYMVFSNVMSYYIGVATGNRTVVMGAMPLGIGARAGSELPKNIHLLSQQGPLAKG
jgi:hypothetical protein